MPVLLGPWPSLVRTISHDGTGRPDQVELLGAVCATLHCPLPPFVLMPVASGLFLVYSQ